MSDEQEIRKLRESLNFVTMMLYAIALLLMVYTLNTCSAVERINSRLWDTNEKLGDIAHAIRTHR